MSKAEVSRFLILCKIAAQVNFILEPTEKNKKTLPCLGYTIDDVKEDVMNLEVRDYVRGPIQDNKGYDKHFWEFGKTIQGKEIYIKLKVKDRNSEGDKCLSTLCISFHFAEKPLTYPYK